MYLLPPLADGPAGRFRIYCSHRPSEGMNPVGLLYLVFPQAPFPKFFRFHWFPDFVEIKPFRVSAVSLIRNGRFFITQFRLLQFNMLWKCFLSHDTPHFVDIGQRIEAFVVMVIERPLPCHFVDTISFCDEAHPLC